MVFGRVMTFIPAFWRRSAFFCVPPPPRQTTASAPSSRAFSTIAPRMSMTWSPTRILCGLSREVPRIVPPRVRIDPRQLLGAEAHVALLHQAAEAVTEPDHLHAVGPGRGLADRADGGVQARRVPAGGQNPDAADHVSPPRSSTVRP